jgi:PAS domain S-box-containing protein
MWKDVIFSDAFYRSIPDDDLISKQRFKLFRTTSFVGTFACLIFVIQSLTVYSVSDPIVIMTFVIGMVFMANLILLPKHRNTKLAYIVIGITSVLIIHLNQYDEGGIRASASFYMAPITLMMFMLLGNKIGRVMFLGVILNAAYFYYISENTSWVSWKLTGTSASDINTDYLITGIFAAIILGAQMNYLESGKNVVIQRITEQRNELREKNKELRKLSIVASKADNAIIVTDKNGVAEWVNDGFVRLTGYSFDEIVGQKPDEILYGKNTDRLMLSDLRVAIQTNTAFSGELLKYRKDKTRFWTQITMTPIAADEEGDERLIFIESDITPRKIAEEKMKQYMLNLEKTNSELDKFAYVVSHDLKAPLRAIGNLTGWIEEDMGDRLPEEMQAHFTTIKGRVVRMEGLINGILDYTKAAKNGGTLESFRSEDLLRETVDLIGAPKNAVINLRTPLPEMKTEKIKLQQVFLNLIHNAVKYNDKEDIQVEVGCEDKGAEWSFYVKDNGPGIEARYHEKIFVIFQTLNARDEVESRGVGLAIVKKIIEEEGGKITVNSEKGKGATFSFTWPKVKKAPVEESILIEEGELV